MKDKEVLPIFTKNARCCAESFQISSKVYNHYWKKWKKKMFKLLDFTNSIYNNAKGKYIKNILLTIITLNSFLTKKYTTDIIFS